MLLSLLVLIFKFRKDGDSSPLPTDVLELYTMATKLAVADRGPRVLQMLETISRNNMRMERREFTSLEASSELDQQLRQRWGQLLR